jgi:hypothetical protein
VSAEIDPASWVWKSLRQFDADRIGSVIPDAFTAYARVEHRGEVCKRRPQRQLPEDTLKTVYEILSQETTPPEICWFCVWGRKNLLPVRTPYRPIATPRSVVERGARIGRPHLHQLDREAAVRAHYVYRAPLSDVGTLRGFPWSLTPDLWWPDDHSWFVASDADFTWTYIGGSQQLVDLLCVQASLTTAIVNPEDPIFPERSSRSAQQRSNNVRNGP